MPHYTSIEQFLTETSNQVETYLLQHLPDAGGYAGQLKESMKYSLLAGGKRIRPALAIASFQICGGRGEQIFLATSALEMIHTFSLIHDDLPCMDDDDLRRGKPTNHKVYGEATAVLAGDALCIHAFHLLGKTKNTQCVEILATALGTDGMLGGQMEDLLAEGKEVDLERVRYIHTHKTAALIEASLIIGALLAEADDTTIGMLSKYGKKIGLAFQVVDDILDLEQTTEALGKNAGSDTDNNKATYPAVIGLEKSKQIAGQLMQEAVQELEALPYNTRVLKELAEFIVHRVH